MLVAIAIISVVGIAVSTATGGVAGQIYSLERRTVAHWVAENHLTWRVSVLKLANMKTDIARAFWAEYRETVDTTFVNWFEAQIYDGEFTPPGVNTTLAHQLNLQGD